MRISSKITSDKVMNTLLFVYTISAFILFAFLLKWGYVRLISHEYLYATIDFVGVLSWMVNFPVGLNTLLPARKMSQLINPSI